MRKIFPPGACCPIMCPKDSLVNIQCLLSRKHMQHCITGIGPCPASNSPWPVYILCTPWVSPGEDASSQSLAWKISVQFCMKWVRGENKKILHPSIETFCPGSQHPHVMVPAASLLAICFPPPTMFQPLCVLCTLIPHPLFYLMRSILKATLPQYGKRNSESLEVW